MQRTNLRKLWTFFIVLIVAGLTAAVATASNVVDPFEEELKRHQPAERLPSQLTIDFDAVRPLPDILRSSLFQAFASKQFVPPSEGTDYTVSAFQIDGEWANITLVPSHVIGIGWEEELDPAHIVEVVAYRGQMQWYAHSAGTDGYTLLMMAVPDSFMGYAREYDGLGDDSRAPDTTYLFPWTQNHRWYKTGGWHGSEGRSIDVQNVPRSSDPDYAVLAAAPGRLREICNDTSGQSWLAIDHADGTTVYGHMEANTIRRDLLNQNVEQGQYLGLLYKRSGGSFGTPCGYGSAFHLHFTLPNKNLTINGYGANTVAGSAFATQYTSSNARLDNGSANAVLSNVSFESNSREPWTIHPHNNACNWAIYSGGAKHGTYYFATNEKGHPSDCNSFYQDIAYMPNVNDTYRFAIWVRSRGSTRTLSPTIWALGGSQENGQTTYQVSGTTWQCVETSLQVRRSGHSGLRTEVYLQSNDLVDYNFDSASFTRNGSLICPAPSAPALRSPNNNSTITDNTPTLDWDTSLTAVEYQVMVDNNSNFGSPAVDKKRTSSSYTTSSLSDAKYYWRVRAKHTNGSWGSWSSTRVFTIDRTPPSTPALRSPSHNSTITDNTPTFEWTLSSGTSQYHLVVDNNSNFGSPVVDQSGINGANSSYTHSIALPEGGLYWRMRAKDAVGNWSGWSSTRKVTIDRTPPPVPTLTLPQNNSTIGSSILSFDWGDSTGAVEYQLVLDDNSNFSSLLLNKVVNNSSYSQNVMPNDGDLYWRVRAKDAVGNWSGWSSVYKFTVNTIPSAPDAPVMDTISNPAMGMTFTVRWENEANTVTTTVQAQHNNGSWDTVYTGNAESLLQSNMIAGEWCYRATANNTGGQSTVSNIVCTTVVPLTSSPFTDCASNTGNNATIVIGSDVNVIGGLTLAVGDEIAAFTPTGLCVGRGVWDNNNFALTVWGDDSQTAAIDGLVDGELMALRIWDASAETEYNPVTPTYTQGNGHYATNSFHIIGTIDVDPVAEQNVNLQTGWNIVSFFVAPEEPSLEVVFASISDTLVIVKNNAGQVYWPALNINQIGDIDPDEGYQIYMQGAATLALRGEQIDVTTHSIPLPAGWSIIPYHLDTPSAIETALASLGDALVIVKNNAGQVYWPSLGINQIGSMQPGEGYQIYLNASATLSYSLLSSRASSLPNFIAPTQKHFTECASVTGNNATVVMMVEATLRANDQLVKPMIGDEIGIYRPHDELCVGSAVITGEHIVITAWGDDSQTEIIDGLVANEAFRFRLWQQEEDQELSLGVMFTSGRDHYQPNGISIIDQYTPTAVELQTVNAQERDDFIHYLIFVASLLLVFTLRAQHGTHAYRND
ncbi:MAG: hypothetical protein ACPG8W_01745 [Candidatus Promineifilaceae bacterium]